MNRPPQSASVKPKCVLIVATEPGISAVRLATTLVSVGCRVELMCSAQHPALASDEISAHHNYWPMLPITALRRALRTSHADLLVFSDPLSFMLVEELARWALAKSSEEAVAVLTVLRRSFGSIECLPLARSRVALLAAAEAADVPVPLTLRLRDDADLARVAQEMTSPWMLKADSTWSGFGVHEVRESRGLDSRRKQLQQPLGFWRSLERGWSGREWRHMHVWLRGNRREVIAQTSISGHQRTGIAVCARGRLLDAAYLPPQHIEGAGEPSPALTIVEDEAMLESMRRTVAALGVSGFCSFDFVIEAETRAAVLLNVNLWPSTFAELPLDLSRELCGALVRELMWRELPDCSNRTEESLRSSVPQEFTRDPAATVPA